MKMVTKERTDKTYPAKTVEKSFIFENEVFIK